MTDRLQAALAAMDEAEKAHVLSWDARMICDLIALQRATLDRHRVASDAVCVVCVSFTDPATGDIIDPYPLPWPCPDAAAVLDYWLGEEPT